MRTGLMLAALLLAAPVHAESFLDSIEKYCLVVRDANRLNIAGNPDSPMGREVARDIEQKQGSGGMTYKQLWDLAKTTNLPSCNQMW